MCDSSPASCRLQTEDVSGEEDGGPVPLPFPLPNSYDTILRKYAALSDIVSFEAIGVLAQYAPNNKQLQGLAASYEVGAVCVGGWVGGGGGAGGCYGHCYLRAPVVHCVTCLLVWCDVV